MSKLLLQKIIYHILTQEIWELNKSVKFFQIKTPLFFFGSFLAKLKLAD